MDPFWMGVLVTLGVEAGLIVIGVPILWILAITGKFGNLWP